jgi:predicted DNA-binding transcriptional regulator AlpA
MAHMNGTSMQEAEADNPSAGPLSSQAGKGQRTRAQHNPMPAGGLRRGLSRPEAATYVGVSPTLFDRAVAEGKMPKPFRLYGRVLWDIRKLDVAITTLDTDDAADDPWGRMAP